MLVGLDKASIIVRKREIFSIRELYYVRFAAAFFLTVIVPDDSRNAGRHFARRKKLSHFMTGNWLWFTCALLSHCLAFMLCSVRRSALLCKLSFIPTVVSSLANWPSHCMGGPLQWHAGNSSQAHLQYPPLPWKPFKTVVCYLKTRVEL